MVHPAELVCMVVELLVVLLLKALVLVVVEVHKPQAALEAIIIAVLLELVARV